MVRHMTAAPVGCGRDLYIHMRDDVRKGMASMTRDFEAAWRHKQRPVNEEVALRQNSTSKRLATPSPRQIRITTERINTQDSLSMKQLKLAMPFERGVSLEEREGTIRKIHRESFANIHSPLPRSPISPLMLTANSRKRSSAE